MKSKYKIQLYHSPLFKIVVGVLLLITVARLVALGYIVFTHFSSGGTFYEFFFPQSDLFGLAIPTGIRNLVDFVLSIVLSVLWAFILFHAAFLHKMIVDDEYLKIHYAPRLFNRYILKKNIQRFAPVKSEVLTFGQKLLNLNFSHDDLYEIVCYNKRFIVACKDKSQLERLQNEIDAARAANTDAGVVEEQKITDWWLMYTIFVVIVYILDYARTLLF